MKILGINGSPHKDGNTYKLINEIFKGAKENGHTTEMVHLIDLNLQYCTWCFRCAENGVCQTSDVFIDHLNKILKADILIVGTPVSTHSVTGYMKNWLDRFCNSQLIFDVADNGKVTKISRIPNGKRSIIIVQGCTDSLDSALDPINVVMEVLNIPVIEKILIKKVGLTEEDTIDKRTELMEKAHKIGASL